MALESSTTSSTFTCSSLLTSPDPDEYDEHNMWNPTLGLFCHVDIGVINSEVLDDDSMGKIEMSCHFAVDIQCGKELC